MLKQFLLNIKVLLFLLFSSYTISTGILIRLQSDHWSNETEEYGELIEGIGSSAYDTEGIFINSTWYLRFNKEAGASSSNSIQHKKQKATYSDPTGQFELIRFKKGKESLPTIQMITKEDKLPTHLCVLLTGKDEEELPIAGQHLIKKIKNYTYIGYCGQDAENEPLAYQVDIDSGQLGGPVFWRESPQEKGSKLIGFISGSDKEKGENVVSSFEVSILDPKTIEWIENTIRKRSLKEEFLESSSRFLTRKQPSTPREKAGPSRTTSGVFGAVSSKPIFWNSKRALFIAPYIQPGFCSDFSNESCTILWQCNSSGPNLSLRFREEGSNSWEKGGVFFHKATSQKSSQKGISQNLYWSPLSNLSLNTTYWYEILEGKTTIYRSTFKTRKTGDNFKFVVFGDSGVNPERTKNLSKLIQQRNPDFVLHTGDLAYNKGRISQFRKKLFSGWNSIEDPKRRLMSTVPLYPTLGNHDIEQTVMGKVKPLEIRSRFIENNDRLGYLFYFRLPTNGPILTQQPLIIYKEKDTEPDGVKISPKAKEYLANFEPMSPKMFNYSFDYGNAHIVVLDGNYYINQDLDNLSHWLKNDLLTSQAMWKIVSIHQPPFSSYVAALPKDDSDRKYIFDAARTRILLEDSQELFDIAFSGHVHIYEREKPLFFHVRKKYRKDTKQATLASIYEELTDKNLDERFKIKIDDNFNGKTKKTTQLPHYVISGAAGKLVKAASSRQLIEGGALTPRKIPVRYKQKLYYKRPSFTEISVEGNTLHLRQVNNKGKVIDSFELCKE